MFEELAVLARRFFAHGAGVTAVTGRIRHPINQIAWLDRHAGIISIDPRTELFDPPYPLVTKDDRERHGSGRPADDMQVAATHATDLDAQKHFPGFGFGDRHIPDFKT
ncbi:hypothetical protein LTR94_035183, partial [Friedmanniomyces endolithicus]